MTLAGTRASWIVELAAPIFRLFGFDEWHMLMCNLLLGTLTSLAPLIIGTILILVNEARCWFRPLNGETCMSWRAFRLIDSALQVNGVPIVNAVDPTLVLLVQEALQILSG